MADKDDSSPREYVNPKYRHVLRAMDSAIHDAVRQGAVLCSNCGGLRVLMIEHDGQVFTTACSACN